MDDTTFHLVEEDVNDGKETKVRSYREKRSLLEYRIRIDMSNELEASS